MRAGKEHEETEEDQRHCDKPEAAANEFARSNRKEHEAEPQTPAHRAVRASSRAESPGCGKRDWMPAPSNPMRATIPIAPQRAVYLRFSAGFSAGSSSSDSIHPTRACGCGVLRGTGLMSARNSDSSFFPDGFPNPCSNSARSIAGVA